MTRGLIFDIQSFAIHDGPGVRTVVFMKGCPLRCWWCHNPESRLAGPEIMFTEFKCVSDCLNCIDTCRDNALLYDSIVHDIDRSKCTKCGDCSESCPTGAIRTIGRWIQPDDVLKEVEKYTQVYDNSGGGVTFSGGDPLFQPEFLKESLKLCKSQRINTAIETSGYASKKVLKSVIPYTDLFLYDIKLSDSGQHRLYTSVPNESIKENLRYLIENGLGSKIMLRFPIIPGITGTKDNVKGWIDFLTQFKKPDIKNINLLPYHDVGEKFKRIGQEYKMKVHTAPEDSIMQWVKNEFEAIGIKAKIGG